MYTSFRMSCVLFGLVLSVAAGCGGDGGSASDACQNACATSLTLKCPKDTMAACVSECEMLTADPKCGSQAKTYASCSAGRPASDFECDMDTGEAGLKDGICQAEGTAWLACFASGS